MAEQTLYAHWSPKKFSLYFDAEGGSVSTSSKTLTFGNQIGSLPTPTKDHYKFLGWYDANGNRVYESTVPSSATNFTVFARWEIKETTGWVKASEVPSGAQIVDRKYTYRQSTTSSSSTLSGWTLYDTQRTSWSDWSDWSTTNPSDGVRDVESRTEYHYYHWINSKGDTWSSQKDSSYRKEEMWIDQELPRYGSDYTDVVKYNGVLWIKANSSSNHGDVSKTFTRTTYRYRDPIYTYYFYKDCESTSYPTGSNVTNIQEWVRYIPE